MSRSVSSLISPALIVLGTAALAQDKDEMCAVTSDIAGTAALERASGAKQNKTAKAITSDLEGSAADYVGAVDPIVAWVWTLPEDQLTEEVAVAYKTACLAQ